MKIAAYCVSLGESMKSNKVFERVIHGIFLILGLVTVACVLLITVYLVISGIPAIMEIGLWDFLFGRSGTRLRPIPNTVSCPLFFPAFMAQPGRW